MPELAPLGAQKSTSAKRLPDTWRHSGSRAMSTAAGTVSRTPSRSASRCRAIAFATLASSRDRCAILICLIRKTSVPATRRAPTARATRTRPIIERYWESRIATSSRAFDSIADVMVRTRSRSSRQVSERMAPAASTPDTAAASAAARSAAMRRSRSPDSSATRATWSGLPATSPRMVSSSVRARARSPSRTSGSVDTTPRSEARTSVDPRLIQTRKEFTLDSSSSVRVTRVCAANVSR